MGSKTYFVFINFFMSLVMSGAMSLSMMLLSSGLLAFDYLSWIQSWGLSMSIAFPVSMLTSPSIRALTDRVFEMSLNK